MVTILRSGFAKFFAVWIVALVASPLTAPFSTYDIAAILSESSIHANPGASKLIQEVIDLGGIVSAVLPAFSDVESPTANRPDVPDAQPVVFLAFRI